MEAAAVKPAAEDTDELKELTFPVAGCYQETAQIQAGVFNVCQALQSVDGTIKNEPITAALRFSRKIYL